MPALTAFPRRKFIGGAELQFNDCLIVTGSKEYVDELGVG